jgi:hypothetical protein
VNIKSQPQINEKQMGKKMTFVENEIQELAPDDLIIGVTSLSLPRK